MYGVKEKTSAAYVQANFSGDRWSGNVGLRYVQHRQSDITLQPGIADRPARRSRARHRFRLRHLPADVTVNNDYNDLLPSANFKFDLTDDLVAAPGRLADPDPPGFLRAGRLAVTDDLTHTGSGGNPQLKPIVSTNFDASLEWYFAPRALLSASVFYMDMKDYVDVRQRTAASTRTSSQPQCRHRYRSPTTGSPCPSTPTPRSRASS